jgi:hypothetical protein
MATAAALEPMTDVFTALLVATVLIAACGGSKDPALKGIVGRYCASQETQLKGALDRLKGGRVDTARLSEMTSRDFSQILAQGFSFCVSTRKGPSDDLSALDTKFYKATEALMGKGREDRAVAEAAVSDMVESYRRLNEYQLID